MYLPPLQPVTNLDIRVCGDVEIHPTASIASGVILQAAPNSRIVIGVDVCIGMGTIISACGGVVEIGDGATLGSGVLVVGCSKVGNNACVGTSTTVINADVESMKTIAPGSIIGESSLEKSIDPIDNLSEPTVETKAEPEPEKPDNQAIANKKKVVKTTSANSETSEKDIEKNIENTTNTDLADRQQSSSPQSVNNNSHDPWEEAKITTEDLKEEVDLEIKGIEKNIETHDGTAIGKVYIDQLLVTLFPHKKQS